MTSIVYILFLPRITILNQCPGSYNLQSNNFHGTNPTTILSNPLMNYPIVELVILIHNFSSMLVIGTFWRGQLVLPEAI
jgi:hypothetical protein